MITLFYKTTLNKSMTFKKTDEKIEWNWRSYTIFILLNGKTLRKALKGQIMTFLVITQDKG